MTLRPRRFRFSPVSSEVPVILRFEDWISSRRLGTRNRHATFTHRRDRWPTCKGENPPQGIEYRAVQVWLWPSRHSFEFRWWRW